MRAHLCCILAALLSAKPAAAYIAGAFVLPHGSIAQAPQHFNTTCTGAKADAEARAQGHEIHEACVAVGKEIARLKPDLILLSTPHGITDLERFQFYLGPRAEGATDSYCPHCEPVSVRLGGQEALDLVTRLKKHHKIGAMVSAFGGYGPPGASASAGSWFPLRWGETIPIGFIPADARARARFLVLSQPSRRVAEAVAMIPEELELGAALATELEKLPERVVVVISADGAHAHVKDGPYGFHEHAEPFGKLSCKWADSLDAEVLTKQAAEYVPQAKTCGYTGLVMLQGLLTQLGLDHWAPKCLAVHAPDYYGMLVARFDRLQGDSYTAEL